MANKKEGWIGFDDRKFLSDSEYETYRRRLPVRFSARNASKKPEKCEICGLHETKDNPLQAAHKIPFNSGLLKYRLTPDFLDKKENLIWAHRTNCNNMAELNHEQILEEINRVA